MSRQKSSGRFRFVAASILLAALVFLVPALQNGSTTLYMLAVLIPCAVFLSETVLARMFSLDRMVMALVLYLCTLGIASLALSDPDAAVTQSLRCGAGLAALLIGGILIRSLSQSLLTASCATFLGLLLLAGKLLSSSLSLPLSEAAQALLLIAFAALFARQGPVSALLIGIAGLALLLVRGEPAEAALWGITVLLLVFAADGRLVVVLPALAAELLLFFCVFRVFPGASQSNESLSILASSGAIGSDLLPEGIEALDSVSLFPRLTGHFGLIFSGLTALLFLPLALRGTSVAACARTRFHAVLAMGAALLLSLRSIAALLSVFGFLPLSGLRLPFLTSSLPDLCAELLLAGLLCGISGRSDADLAEDAHLAMLAK